MDDFEDLPVETVAGDRPVGTVADRLLIGLAGLALLGGLLIAAVNALSGFLPDTAAAPSTHATPSAADPTPTPRPSPTERALREVSVIPGAPEVDEPDLGGFATTYWIEALAPVPIHAFPESDEVIGRIRAGAISIAEEQPWDEATSGWLFAHGADPPGWIPMVSSSGRPLVQLHPIDRPTFPGTVSAVSAGATGFVVHGSLPVIGWQPAEPITVFSADGQTWSRAAVETTPWGGWGAAWGPSGWLATSPVTGPQGIVSVWLWESTSGSDWSAVGELDFPTNETILGFVGSERGYLLALASSDDGSADLWFSPDGLVWQESRGSIDDIDQGALAPFGPQALRIAASTAGFLAWTFSDAERRDVVAAYSADGRTWMPIQLASDAGTAWLTLAATGDRIVALGRDAAGTVRAYSASLPPGNGALALERASHLEVAFDGAVVWSLISDGDTAYAFGTDRQDGLDLAWAGNGRQWRRIGTPDGGFGQPVTVVAAGPTGVLALGTEPNGVVSDPVLWHLRNDGQWARPTQSIIPPTPQPSPADCGNPPDTAVEFMGLDPTVAVPCFGDRQMTFTAWSVRCRGCHGGGVLGPRPGIGWLMNPARTFLLLPIEDRSGTNGYTREAIPARDLEWRDSYVGRWLRITGHYDDPTAAECGRLPAPTGEFYWLGPNAQASYCRRQFVVTEATAVNGPGS